MSDTSKKAASEAVDKQAAAAQETAQSAARSARKSANGNGLPGVDVAVPEAMRSLAEKTVTQSREAYERAKGAMEDTVDTVEKSFDKAGQGAAAFNRKVIDIAQANVNSGFDLAKALSGARTVGEIVELQAAFARKQFEAFSAQADELRTLSAKLANDAAEPMKAQMSRSFDLLKRAG